MRTVPSLLRFVLTDRSTRGPICKKNIGGSPTRGAAGAEGVGRGCPHPHWGRLGMGLCPLPRKFFDLSSENSEFQCILGSILSQFSSRLYSKNQCFWLTEHFSIYCIIKWRVLVDCDVLHVLLIVVVNKSWTGGLESTPPTSSNRQRLGGSKKSLGGLNPPANRTLGLHCFND